MRRSWLILFLFGVLAWGQEKPAAPLPGNSTAAAKDDDDKAVPPPASAANIAPDAAVLTIKGLCPEASPKPEAAQGSDCKTVITRAEFEKMARAIQPNLSPVVKRQLVATYPRLLIMTHEAEARGLDKDEYFQLMIGFARMQILNQQLMKRVQQEAAKVPEKEMADYYKNNPDNFREYTIEHVFIPRVKQEPPPPQKLSKEAQAAREKNEESEMTKEAEALRVRAAAGESMEALQKEAYQVAGLKSNPPNASMGKIRRAGLPPGHEAAFVLKAGEVSAVINDAGGHYIYKMDGVSLESMADAREEIHKLLQSQRLHEMMDKIQSPYTTDINEAYFAAPSPPSDDDPKPKPAGARE